MKIIMNVEIRKGYEKWKELFNSAGDAVQNGVRGVVILDGRKPHSVLHEIFSDKGSGCIALMMKSIFPNSEVTGIDISEEAIELANENSKLNSLEVSFFQSNLLENVEESDHDLIVANLPYIPTENLNELDREVIDYEPLTALNGGKDGLEIISNLIHQLEEKDYKKVNLFLEIDSRKSSETLELLNSWDEVKLLEDLAEKDRYVFAKR